jgi:hypothetical protein
VRNHICYRPLGRICRSDELIVVERFDEAMQPDDGRP